jgi:hypothetical protein
MKRLHLLLLAAGLVVASLFVACQDQREPTSPPSVGVPQADVSDALHSRGNPHFFWLSPVVPEPKQRDFNGEFDRTALPTVEIWRLTGDSPVKDCLHRLFDPGEIDGFSDHFHAAWTPTVGAEPGCPVADGNFVRVFVQFGKSGEGVLRYLGYRDYEIGGSGKNRDATKGIGLTETEALKFRIEEDAGCFGDVEGEDPVAPGKDPIDGCAIGTLTEGASQLIDKNNWNTLIVDAGTLKDGTKILAMIEKVTLGPGESCVNIGGVPVDLAQYPDCLKITFSPPEIEEYFRFHNSTLTFGFCPQHEPLMIDAGAQLPRARVLDQEEGEVFVLNRWPTQELDCGSVSSLDSNPLTRFARALLRRILGPVAPQPLYASVAVRHCGRECFVPGDGRSEYVVVGMPASIDANMNVDLGPVAIGQPNPVSVLVRDVDEDPVMLSWVNFTPSAGSEFNGSKGTTRLQTFGIPNTTHERNGAAGGDWTLNEPGIHTLTAGGVGYSTPPIMGDDEEDELIWGDKLSPDPVNVVFTAEGFRQIEFEAPQLDGNVCDHNLGPVEVLVRDAEGQPEGGVQVVLEAFNNNGKPARISDDGGQTYETQLTRRTGDEGGADEGIASFNPVCITKPGGYHWRATAPELGIAIESEVHFNIRPGK